MPEAKLKHRQGIIPLEIRDKPKKSLGYGFIVSTSRIRPVTGREWVFTATDEQMAVLYDIEKLFGGLVGDKYHYVFREVHGFYEDEDFEGWTLLVRNKETGRTSWREFSGFPPSAAFVLDAVLLQTKTIKAAEEAEANGGHRTLLEPGCPASSGWHAGDSPAQRR